MRMHGYCQLSEFRVTSVEISGNYLVQGSTAKAECGYEGKLDDCFSKALSCLV